jgi:hypothetical protein
MFTQVSSDVEAKVPDSLHDTGDNKNTGKVSHATGDSKVPQFLQEGLPEKVEKAVPNAIHDVSAHKGQLLLPINPRGNDG